jgi:hypothetical protein
MAVIGDQNSLEPILVKHRRGRIHSQHLIAENRSVSVIKIRAGVAHFEVNGASFYVSLAWAVDCVATRFPRRNLTIIPFSRSVSKAADGQLSESDFSEKPTGPPIERSAFPTVSFRP